MVLCREVSRTGVGRGHPPRGVTASSRWIHFVCEKDLCREVTGETDRGDVSPGLCAAGSRRQHSSVLLHTGGQVRSPPGRPVLGCPLDLLPLVCAGGLDGLYP